MLEHLLTTAIWAGAGLIGVKMTLNVFQKPIAELISRAERVGKDGIVAPIVRQVPAPVEKSGSLVAFIKESATLPTVAVNEAAIRSDLKRRGLDDLADANEALIRALALHQAQMLFERAAAPIFGSQLDLLQYLAARPAAVGQDELQPFYAAGAARSPAAFANYPFADYLSFLESFGLTARHDGLVEITQAGRDFSSWYIQSGRQRPLAG